MCIVVYSGVDYSPFVSIGMSRKTSNVFRTTFLTMDGTFDPNESQLFFRPLQAPLNTTDNSYYSLAPAQFFDPTLRINKYDSNGIQGSLPGYLYDTQINPPTQGKFAIVAGGSAPNTLVYSQNRVYWIVSPTGSSFLTTSCLAIAYDGFTWLAGGIGSRNVVYSSNGENWLDISGASNILTVQCSAIATNGDLWVAGGIGSDNYCGICFSYDLITWYNTSANIRNIFVQGTVASLAYNGIIWLAGGSYVTGTMFFPLAVSNDGIYWTGLSVTTALLNECYALCWNGSLWLAGGNYSGSARILYSIDGNDWNIAALNGAITTSVRSIAWNGTIFVAGGYDVAGLAHTLAYSYDGVTWLPITSDVFPTLCNGVMWDSITWQAVGQGGIATSPDGILWQTNIQGTSLLPEGNAIALNAKLPLVAPTTDDLDPTSPLALIGGYDTITGCTIAYSIDGITWKSSSQVPTVFGTTIATALSWNGTIWVGGFINNGSDSYPSIGYSYNGIIWNSSSSGSAIVPRQVKAVAWGLNKFIALGSNLAGTTYLIRSYNGLTWTNISGAPPGLSDTSGQLQYNGTVWVLTNVTSLYYSYDGDTWSTSTSGSTIFNRSSNSLAWNGRLWVAGGVNSVTGNTVGYSSDGITWSQGILTYSPGVLNSMAWNGSLFICGSSSTSLGYSYDGITWYPAEYVPVTPTPVIRSVTWTGAVWVATGVSLGVGVVLYSYNGTIWHNSSNGSLVVSNGGNVVATNRVNPYNGNTLPPPVLNQGITTSGGYGIITSNANNLYKSSLFYLDETNGLLGINQTTKTYTDISGELIKAALEISGGGITVNTYGTTALPGLYLSSSNVAADSGGRIELYDALNGFGWRIDNNIETTVNRLQIKSRAGDDAIQLAMDMRHDTQTVGMGILADTTNRLTVNSNVSIVGNLVVSGIKSFLIDHPNPALKDTHTLRHSCVEGPTRGETLNRWLLTTSNLSCIQALPSYSPYLNENWQFLVSAENSFGTGYIILSEDETFFTLHASEDGSYSVVGVATRKDKDSLQFDKQGTEPIKNQ